MSQPKNVQIPYELFMAILHVFEHVDVSNYAEDFQTLYDIVFDELKNKKLRIELRDDYSRLVEANRTGDEDKQHEARIEYLKNRQRADS